MRKAFFLLSALVLFAGAAFCQNRTITGRVVDDQGDPIAGASVRLKNTRTGVAADNNGNFRILAKTGDVLVISGAGLEQREVTVGDESNINVTVKRLAVENTAVVVTTGLGITRAQKTLGYSASTVQAKDLVVAKPISVVNGLTGKVSGLQVNTVNNGLFAPTRVTLRGNRSLTGNNTPLVVVDGTIYYNDINTLNPDDIADITVLKGSSASAIYGSDASNGVLVVTTKKGVKGAKPTLTFTTTTQIEILSYQLKMQNRFGSNGGEKFVDDFNDLSTYIPYENQSYGPEYNGAIVPIGRPVYDGSLYLTKYSALPNEKRKFFDRAPTEQNSLSYTAGDETSRFYLSMQDIYTRSTMPGDKGRRDVFRLGGSKTYGSFTATYSASYTYRNTNTTNTGTVYQMVMNTPAHIPITRFKDWRNDKFADLNGFYNDYFDNPYFDIDNYRNISTSDNLSGNMELGLKVWKWLNLKYRVAINNLANRFEYRQGVKAFSTYAKTDPRVIYSNYSGNGLDTVIEAPKYNVVTAAAPAFSNSNFTNFLLTSDFLATIDHKITKNLNMNLTLGTTYIDNKENGIGVQAAALFIPVYNINNISGTPTTGGGNFNAEANKLGLFSDIALSWKGWANLHASYRSDLDSRLSHSNRFIPYYDVDAAIVLSDVVNAIKNSKVLSFAKIRGAYSVTGNASALGGGSTFIAGGAYVINPVYGVASGFPFGNIGGYALSTSLANPNIKPETIIEREGAIELGFFKDRYTFKATYYSTNLSNGIVPASTSSASGFYSALLNAANVSTSGEEVELQATIIRKKNTTWKVGGNYTHFQNQVTSINGNLPSLQIGGNNGNAFAVVGQPYPMIETRDWVRDGDGHVIVDPISGNPSRNSQLTILGNATPKDILGITSTFTWKNLSLTATIDYRGGYKIFNSIGQYIDFTGISYVTAVTGRQRFVFPNSVTVDASGKSTPNTNIEVDDANFNFWPGLYRSVGANYVTSAAAWKLRELALSCDLPNKWYDKAKIIHKATFSISGRNLWMIRPKTNQWTDPEFNEDAGNDVGRNGTGQAPPTRIISATLSVSF